MMAASASHRPINRASPNVANANCESWESDSILCECVQAIGPSMIKAHKHMLSVKTTGLNAGQPRRS